MSRSAAVRSDQIIQVGPALAIPGLAALDLRGAPLFMHNFGGLIDGVNAVVAQGGLYVPFRAKIVLAKIRVRAQMGTGPALIELGTTADVDRFASRSVPTSAAAGVTYEYVLDADFATSRIIEADTVLIATGDGGATTTGGVDACIVFTPFPA